MRGWDRRSWGSTNDRWLWTFPILFPVAVVVLLPIALVYSAALAVNSLWRVIK